MSTIHAVLTSLAAQISPQMPFDEFICPRAQKPSRGILCVLVVCVKRNADAAINCLSEPLGAASNVSLRYC